MSGVSVSSPSVVSYLKSNKQAQFSSISPRVSCLSGVRVKTQLGLRHGIAATECNRVCVRCNCSAGPAGIPPFGDGDNKSVLDAFFLGKALAEALSERIESTVGEFLSTVGKLQAEQQKLIQEFQEDVLERAKKAKYEAARETGQEEVSKPAITDDDTMEAITPVVVSSDD